MTSARRHGEWIFSNQFGKKKKKPPPKLDINELVATEGKTDCCSRVFFFFFLDGPYVCVLSFRARLVAAGLPPLKRPAGFKLSNIWSASGHWYAGAIKERGGSAPLSIKLDTAVGRTRP